MKNKGRLFWILALVTLAFAAGPGSAKKLEPIWKEFKNTAGHFSVKSPYSFVTGDAAAGSGQTTFQNSPQIGNTQIFIVITKHPGKLDIASVPDQVLADLEKRQGYGKFASKSKRTKKLKCPAVLTKRTFAKNGNVAMAMKELDAVKGHVWYCVMVFYDFGNKGQDRMADQVIGSFKILN